LFCFVLFCFLLFFFFSNYPLFPIHYSRIGIVCSSSLDHLLGHFGYLFRHRRHMHVVCLLDYVGLPKNVTRQHLPALFSSLIPRDATKDHGKSAAPNFSRNRFFPFGRTVWMILRREASSFSSLGSIALGPLRLRQIANGREPISCLFIFLSFVREPFICRLGKVHLIMASVVD
jgi:hypothetical protein